MEKFFEFLQIMAMVIAIINYTALSHIKVDNYAAEVNRMVRGVLK
jgi:hypothetical protein